MKSRLSRGAARARRLADAYVVAACGEALRLLRKTLGDSEAYLALSPELRKSGYGEEHAPHFYVCGDGISDEDRAEGAEVATARLGGVGALLSEMVYAAHAELLGNDYIAGTRVFIDRESRGAPFFVLSIDNSPGCAAHPGGPGDWGDCEPCDEVHSFFEDTASWNSTRAESPSGLIRRASAAAKTWRDRARALLCASPCALCKKAIGATDAFRHWYEPDEETVRFAHYECLEARRSS